LVESGADKQAAVAAINRLQAELEITVEAAAIVYAKRQGIEIEPEADAAIAEL
jgi:hypothetical protein